MQYLLMHRWKIFFIHLSMLFFKMMTKKKIQVFNASQKTAQGASLNSFLHAGPKFQEDDLAVVTRFSKSHLPITLSRCLGNFVREVILFWPTRIGDIAIWRFIDVEITKTKRKQNKIRADKSRLSSEKQRFGFRHQKY